MNNVRSGSARGQEDDVPADVSIWFCGESWYANGFWAEPSMTEESCMLPYIGFTLLATPNGSRISWSNLREAGDCIRVDFDEIASGEIELVGYEDSRSVPKKGRNGGQTGRRSSD